MNKDTLTQKDYLGDGVYCGFDGYHIWVWTQDSLPIAFEPAVLNTLYAYARRVLTPPVEAIVKEEP